MKNVKVLGTGCANCETTARLIEEIAVAKGTAIQLEKVTDMAAILGYGVMSTPGVVVDGKLVHAGGVPDRKKVEGWLAPAGGTGGCCQPVDLIDGDTHLHGIGMYHGQSGLPGRQVVVLRHKVDQVIPHGAANGEQGV